MMMIRAAAIVLGCMVIMTAMNARAQGQYGQEREHTSIHQVESELHRWDELKVDTRAPELARGKDYAKAGDAKKAIVEFQKAARKRPAAGYFNIGLVHYYRRNYPTALHYFQKSEHAGRDSLTHAYIDASKRLIKQRSASDSRSGKR